MKTAQKPTFVKAPARQAHAPQAMPAKALTSRSTAAKSGGRAAKTLAGAVLTQGATATSTPMRALRVTVEVDPLVDVVRRHVRLSPSLARLIKGDFVRLLQNPDLAPATATHPAPTTSADPVLGTQEAADLVGVSRPYIVARIEAGDIPLHQQVGNQRRVLKSAVLAWHRREQTRRRRALGQLGADLDSEIFAG
jgi:excisionase family DNA binding protein